MVFLRGTWKKEISDSPGCTDDGLPQICDNKYSQISGTSADAWQGSGGYALISSLNDWEVRSA